MRQAYVLYKGEIAGVLTQSDDGNFLFEYEDNWFTNSLKPAVSLTLPKNQRSFELPYLFPFFFNMLPEGANKEVVCKYNRLDTDDYFGILLTTATDDTIGAVQVQQLNS